MCVKERGREREREGGECVSEKETINTERELKSISVSLTW